MMTRKKQRGVTLSGLIMACIVLGVAALLVMRLWPIYNEKMKVDQAMDKLASNPDAARMTKPEIVQAIMRQFDVSDVDRFNQRDFDALRGMLADDVRLEEEHLA